jgi:hypothetical protein
MPHRLMTPALADDVLVVGIVGLFDQQAMRLVADCAADRLAPHGPGFGAVLLDLTRASPLHMAPCMLARLWHARLPQRPCAVLRPAFAAGFLREVALLLATAPKAPTPMDAFNPEDRAAAMQWCVDRAATFRCELRRRQRRRASNPGGSG